MPGIHSTHVKVSRDVREQLIGLLNADLANTVDLFLRTKHAHWNLKGPHFYSLHLLFDVVAKHLRKQADTIAERLVALGGYAAGTARMVVNNSQLPEYDIEAVTGEEHVASLVHQLSQHTGTVRQAIERSGDELDELATQDLFITQLRQLEKDLWMLESHLHALHEHPPKHIPRSQHDDGADEIEEERAGESAPSSF